MKKSVLNGFLALCSVFLGACSKKIAYSSSGALKETAKSVVRISVDYIVEDKITLASVERGFVATGFSIATQDNASFILTNQHVCNMGNAVVYILRTSSGDNIRAKFIRSDPFADICLLKAFGVISPLTLAKNNASQGDRIVTIGGPEGIFPIMVDGLISGYHNMHMKNDSDEEGQFEINFRAQVMSAPIYQGSSGSPVINMDGDVVGIVFAVRGEKEHIAFIVPISEVWRFVDLSEYVYMN
jgi:serine protease Do